VVVALERQQYTTINPATGELTGIYVTNPGSGYTTTPTVYINGVGSWCYRLSTVKQRV